MTNKKVMMRYAGVTSLLLVNGFSLAAGFHSSVELAVQLQTPRERMSVDS